MSGWDQEDDYAYLQQQLHQPPPVVEEINKVKRYLWMIVVGQLLIIAGTVLRLLS